MKLKYKVLNFRLEGTQKYMNSKAFKKILLSEFCFSISFIRKL